MGFLKDIWNTIFRKTVKKTDVLSIEKNEKKENLKHFKNKKNVVGNKTKLKIKQYLKENGEINKGISIEKFKIKSLQNVIWELRKEGMKIKTCKHYIKTPTGKTKTVIDYKLMTSK